MFYISSKWSNNIMGTKNEKEFGLQSNILSKRKKPKVQDKVTYKQTKEPS